MFDHLFKPISVNGMILKNRIIATPTGDDFEEKAGCRQLRGINEQSTEFRHLCRREF